MFDDYWELSFRSQVSAGKSVVKSAYQRNSKNHETNSGGLIMSDAGGSQKEAARWAPRHTWARLACGPRPAMAWPPGSTPRLPLRVYLPPENLSTGGRPRNIPPPPRDGNHRERKSSLAGRSCRGNSLPERGNHRHRHRHHAGLHRDHHHHHPLRHHHHLHRLHIHLAVTSRAVPCLVHWGDSPGVDYSLLLMLLSLFGGLVFMSRLLFIAISSLIMIHMMSCE